MTTDRKIWMAGGSGEAEAFSTRVVDPYGLIGQPDNRRISNHFEGDGGFTVSTEGGLEGLGGTHTGTNIGFVILDHQGETIRNTAWNSAASPFKSNPEDITYRCPTTGLLWLDYKLDSYSRGRAFVVVDDTLGNLVFTNPVRIGDNRWSKLQFIGTEDLGSNQYRTTVSGVYTISQSSHRQVFLQYDYTYVPGVTPSAPTQLAPTIQHLHDSFTSNTRPPWISTHVSDADNVTRFLNNTVKFSYFNGTVSTSAATVYGLKFASPITSCYYKRFSTESDGPTKADYPWVLFQQTSWRPAGSNTNTAAGGTHYTEWNSTSLVGSTVYTINTTITDYYTPTSLINTFWDSEFVELFVDEDSQKMVIGGKPSASMRAKYTPSGGNQNYSVNGLVMQIDLATHSLDFAHIIRATSGSDGTASAYWGAFGFNPIAGQYGFYYQSNDDLVVMPCKELDSDIEFEIDRENEDQPREVQDITNKFSVSTETTFPGFTTDTNSTSTVPSPSLAWDIPSTDFNNVLLPTSGMTNKCETLDDIEEW